MTFYWWSHWFWITVLSNLICPLIVFVHTYPSPEATLEYNSKDNPNKLVTRLYQTSTVTWTTTTDIPNYVKTTEGNLKLQHIKSQTSEIAKDDKIKPAPNNNNEQEDVSYEYEDFSEHKLNLEQMEAEQEIKEQEDQEEGSGFLANKEDHEVDNKRSAEDIRNKTPLDTKSELKILENSTALPALETNNYTNFTDDHYPTNSTNTTANAINAESIATTTTRNSSSDSLVTNVTTTQKATVATTNLTTQLPQAPSTPNIVKTQPTGLDWLNSAAHVTTDVTQDSVDEPQKIPFTLENVNKPEDLRREESEHRSRKSKGLSADYKVNRYYSSDSKNLLTRSAATTVNEYESEESSNISSEALSVQRAYFMDIGAISAICFTVFGICCTVGTVGIVLYRRRFLNKPQALSEPDSSVYIDDSTMRVSDNSDEMYSLDNDSFLNSLEAMTIQNYWTDTVKHTKL